RLRRLPPDPERTVHYGRDPRDRPLEVRNVQRIPYPGLDLPYRERYAVTAYPVHVIRCDAAHRVLRDRPRCIADPARVQGVPPHPQLRHPVARLRGIRCGLPFYHENRRAVRRGTPQLAIEERIGAAQETVI